MSCDLIDAILSYLVQHSSIFRQEVRVCGYLFRDYRLACKIIWQIIVNYKLILNG